MQKHHVMSHTLTLIGVIFSAFILARTVGARLEIEITAILFLLYFVVKRFLPKKESHGYPVHVMFDSSIFTLIILNIVLTTGGLQSPMFFLVYFLIFALSLLIEPITSVTTAVALVFLFVVDTQKAFTPESLLQIFSLPFLVPFALYFGQEHRLKAKQDSRIKKLSQQESSTEQDALIFVSTVMRDHLKNIQELAQNFQGDHELAAIRKNIRRMMKLIDAFVDKY